MKDFYFLRFMFRAGVVRVVGRRGIITGARRSILFTVSMFEFLSFNFSFSLSLLSFVMWTLFNARSKFNFLSHFEFDLFISRFLSFRLLNRLFTLTFPFRAMTTMLNRVALAVYRMLRYSFIVFRVRCLLLFRTFFLRLSFIFTF